MKNVILLGATGSIGHSALDVIRNLPEEYKIVGLSAHTNREDLEQIATEFSVSNTALTGNSKESTDPIFSEICNDVASKLVRETEADIVLNGIAGAAGLPPSIAALESGKDLALANKETIVMAGPLVRKLAKRQNRSILPVDSEHAGLFFLLDGIPEKRVSKLVLTASGGAFRDSTLHDMKNVTVRDALNHPTWSMGKKITIDSATMANKGLEIIEAVRLFDAPEHLVEVYIHRQSKVHALVQTTDGTFYAQVSDPDMRVPIQHALSYPDELDCPWGHIDLAGLKLSFETPDPEKYPALELARDAIRRDGEYPVVYNAANEIAVDAFVTGHIGFMSIPSVIEECLAAGWENLLNSFEQVYVADSKARETAYNIISRISGQLPE